MRDSCQGNHAAESGQRDSWLSGEVRENPAGGAGSLCRLVTRALRLTARGHGCFIDAVASEPQEAIDRDSNLLNDLELASGPLLRIWRNARCIVASRSQSTWSLYRHASTVSKHAGWPVVWRRSGGNAVTHGVWTLNVSRFERFPIERRRSSLTTHCYVQLLDLLIESMAKLGVRCDYGSVADASCDGKFNLRWEGRKLAGTAGFITRCSGAEITVFHASITLGGPRVEELQAIERFETTLGLRRNYRYAAHVSLAEILATPRHRERTNIDENRRWQVTTPT